MSPSCKFLEGGYTIDGLRCLYTTGVLSARQVMVVEKTADPEDYCSLRNLQKQKLVELADL